MISVSVVEPELSVQGWRFGDAAGADLDTVNGASFLHEIYTRADPAISGRATVPVLWDKKLGTVVNNESADILRMLNSVFGDLVDDTFDLYPADFRVEIDALNAAYLPGTQQRRIPRGLRHHARSLRGGVSRRLRDAR